MGGYVTPEVAHHRARVGSLTRDRQPDDPELVEARQSLRAASLASHVAKVLDGWPALSDEQLARIAALLTAGGTTG